MTPRRSTLLLLASFALIGSACYSPDVRDCAVTCGPGNSCADGLECGADGFCHTAGHTDMCVDIDGGNPTFDADVNQPDADPNPPDATVFDADLTPDADPGILLRITVAGQGRVQALADGINCNSMCSYFFPADTELTLVGVPQNMNFTFLGWQGDFCVGETAPCTFTLVTETSIGASFSN